MRPLTLHASALNDQEYDLYTACLRDIAWDPHDDPAVRDDQYYEGIRVSLREMRGWIRGRYPRVPPATVDSILALFSSEGETMLTGGQAFAVMRLVLHAHNGRDPDRALAFMQAYPKQEATRNTNPFLVTRAIEPAPTHSAVGVPPLPPRKQLPAAPLPPPRHAFTTPRPVSSPQRAPVSTPPNVAHSPSSSSAVPPAIPPTGPTSPKPHITSTLMKQSLHASKLGQTLKRAAEQREQERVLQVLKSSSVVSGTSVVTSAPSRNRDRDGKEGGEDGDHPQAPPLPRRRNTNETSATRGPPSISSFEQVAMARTPTTPSRPAPPPQTPFPRHNQPPAPPKLQLSLSSSSANSTAIPSSPTHAQHHQNSAEVLASPPPPHRPPPPTHPNRKPTHLGSPTASSFPEDLGVREDSPTARVFRSKSLHYPSSPPAAGAGGVGAGVKSPPPPRRKRPESMQLFPAGGDATLTASLPNLGAPKRRSSLSQTSASASTDGSSSHRRQASHGHSHGHGGGELSGFPLTRLALSLSGAAGGKGGLLLERARYKAEAGLSRRGYLGGGGGGLLAEGKGKGKETDVAPNVDSQSGSGSGSDEDVGREVSRGLWRGGQSGAGMEESDEESLERERERRRWGREVKERWGSVGETGAVGVVREREKEEAGWRLL